MPAILKTTQIIEPSSGTTNLTLDPNGGVSIGANATVSSALNVGGQMTVSANAVVSNFLTVAANGIFSNYLTAATGIGLKYAETAVPIQPIFSVPPGKTKVTFSSTGSDQTFTVPAGITSILVKLWGAGGGGGNQGGWSHGSRGGGGGHTIAVLPVTPGQVLGIVVGRGGQTNYAGGSTPIYGGGGGFVNNTDNRYCGGGGGYTGIFSSTTISQATAYAIAGGGGGGGCSRIGFGNWGGAGGGVNGQNGKASYDSRYTSGGGGGTQTAGGAAGISQAAGGTAGSALTGGIGTTNNYGGGGGGGYFGGGGGGYFESNTMAGGGGGSGYVSPSVYFGMTFCGEGFRPAMYDDADLPKTYDGANNWAHYATGGDALFSTAQTTTLGGGSGFCVIYY